MGWDGRGGRNPQPTQPLVNESHRYRPLSASWLLLPLEPNSAETHIRVWLLPPPLLPFVSIRPVTAPALPAAQGPLKVTAFLCLCGTASTVGLYLGMTRHSQCHQSPSIYEHLESASQNGNKFLLPSYPYLDPPRGVDVREQTSPRHVSLGPEGPCGTVGTRGLCASLLLPSIPVAKGWQALHTSFGT